MNISWLNLLAQLAELLENPDDISESLDISLKLIASNLGAGRAAITLIEPQTGRIYIQASYGLSPSQRKRGAYSPGEGIMGKVIAIGKSICVPDASKEPQFLNRTRARDLDHEKISFLCCPIKSGPQTVGAISIDQPIEEPAILNAKLQLLSVIACLIARAAYERQQRMVDKTNPQKPHGFTGNSEIMRRIYAQIAIVAPSPATVLLQGESGTGKELAARAIHLASPRSDGPFITLNCAALPENLIESELFGHERGAFTGATQMRKGRFELAQDGTLFLDEIGELSLLMQVKLLRVLQEHSFERLGGMETVRSNARLIAATNRDLASMTEDGTFRRDLFYRLNVFPITMPPLRQRKEDIPPLSACFLKSFTGLGKNPARVSHAAMDLLQHYEWPGNIRELRNAMERAALLCGTGNIILPQHLPSEVRGSAGMETGQRQIEQAGDLQTTLDEVEKFCILNALSACHGHINKTAKALGLTERILSLRLKKYNIDRRDYKKDKN